MGLSLLAGSAARAAVLFVAALAAMPLLRRAEARVRRRVLAFALAAALALPIVSLAAARVLPGRAMPRLIVLPVATPLAEWPITTAAREPAASPEADATAAAATSAPPLAARVTWRDAVGVIWLLGAIVALGRVAGSMTRVRGVVRRGAPVAGAWTETLAAASAELGVRADARITADVEAPAVAGIVRPMLLLPRAALAWAEPRRRVVALHELSHVRHGDPLARLVGQLACALYWFLPPAWWTARRLRAESELAADERVVRAGVRATAYAEHLLAIAAHAGGVDWARGGAIAMAARPSELSRRIVALVSRDGAPPAITRRRAAALWIASGSTALLVACAGVGDGRRAETAGRTETTSGEAARPSVAAPVAAGPTSRPSTIDPRIQQIVEEEAARVRAEWRPNDVVVVALDPSSGAILAVTSSDAVGRAIVPGSTMKVFTIAAALDAGAIRLDQRFSCDARSYGAQTLHDATPHGPLDAAGILAVSSNVGTSRIYDATGGARLLAALTRLHFGEAPAGLDGAANGAVPASLDAGMNGARVAIGVGLTASPIQIAAGFAAVVNGGVYHAPTLVSPQPAAGGERVLGETTARTMRSLLVAAIESPESTGKAARVAGVRVAGKTGTSSASATDDPPFFASFVGAAPADDPHLVVFVGVDGPSQHGRPGSGGEVAAPAFARITARALAH